MRPNVFASISVDFQLRFIRAGLPKSPVLGSGHLVAGHTERGGKKIVEHIKRANQHFYFHFSEI